MIKNKTVLITGGAGFIGSHLAQELCTENHVKVFDNFSTGSAKNLRGIELEIIEGDIRNLDEVKNALNGVNIVFHEAAVVSVDRATEDPFESMSTNILGTLNLLNACLDSDVERIIYASSSEVYGEPEYLPMDEKHPLNPNSCYGVSKLAGERYCLVFHELYGLKTTCLRYFNVYGPRQRSTIYGGVVSIFVKRLLENKPPIIFGDGNQTRDFTYIRDNVLANILAVNKRRSIGEVINIGTQCQTSINKLAELLIKITDSDLTPEYTKPRPNDILRREADISKAKRLLGYEPRYTLEKGLEELVEWAKKEY